MPMDRECVAMRLHELTKLPPDVRDAVNREPSGYGSPISRRRWERELRSVIDRYNLTRLGAGAYGAVYSLPGKDYVLKIFTTDDVGYMKWVEYCLAHPSKWVPKLSRPVTLSAHLSAVRVEPLTPITDSSMGVSLHELINALNQPDVSGREFYNRIFPGILDDPDFFDIAAFLNANDTQKDIHSENIMLRGHQVVITDPLI